MSTLCIDLPPIAPDYSGAASALFDLGGIVVMHDASGCTGNYTGFDEPRWLGSRSAVYCSGLRRMDAVLGNDRKFIDGALEAAKDLDPTLIAYLGSPVPMVIGIDLEGMAMETEEESGIPSFGFNTTGQRYYDKGASDVFLKLIRRFTKKPAVSERGEGPKRVNVLGLLSVDMGNEANSDEICAHIQGRGYEINSRFAMGLTVEQIERAAQADLGIVVSRCGLDAAQLLERKYKIPYICGVPVGDGQAFDEKLAQWETAAHGAEEKVGTTTGGKILIVHEQILSNSIREAIRRQADASVTVGSMYGLDARLSAEGDLNLVDELSVRRAVNSGDYSVVIADPEIGKLIRRDDITFLPLPHVAISGRLYLEQYVHDLGENMERLIDRAVSAVK